jgi:hypothetical protein
MNEAIKQLIEQADNISDIVFGFKKKDGNYIVSSCSCSEIRSHLVMLINRHVNKAISLEIKETTNETD